MTVSTTASTTQAFPNGVTTVFPINYRFFAKTDLKVFWLKPDGTVHLLVLDSEYTVQGAGNEDGGSITTIGTPLNGGTLTIARIMTATQLTSFRNQGEFFAEIHEDAFDKLVMLVQQAIDNQGRGLTVPVSDPVGLDLEMPGAAVRATKMLGFDGAGSPIQSNLTMQQLEEQPALALAAAQAAAASASGAGGSASSASTSASAAAASAAAVTGAAVPMFQVSWWPGSRASIPAGYVPGDGQTLTRALYPDAWTAINAGNMPTATDAAWNSTPAERGKYTAGNGSTTFRVPDYNGKFAGSFGALFLRGDGALSAGTTGAIQRDALQGHWHEIRRASGSATIRLAATSGAGSSSTFDDSNLNNADRYIAKDIVSDGVNGTPRVDAETRPLNVTGCWIIKLYGAVVNTGSVNIDNLADRIAALEARQLGLGDGQAWQDMTASRAVGTTYTNTTGRTIALSIFGVMTTGNIASIYIGLLQVASILNSGAEQISLTAIVPAGATYRLTSSNTPSSLSWRELRV